jgi:hypothetical protein
VVVAESNQPSKLGHEIIGGLLPAELRSQE